MKVEKVFGTVNDGYRTRTVLKIANSYTPYAIVSGYNPNNRPGEQWDSSYGYYTSKQTLAEVILKMVERSIGYGRTTGKNLGCTL